MSTLAVTENWADGDVLTATQLSDAMTSIETVINGNIDSTNIAASGVDTGNLAAGILSANAAGRAKMAAGYFSADATGLAKFEDGFLTADAAGRAKMADGYINTAKLGTAAVTAPKLDAGVLVGRAYTENTGSATSSSTIPVDDTIPQVTEGEQRLSQAYTPKDANSKLRVRAAVPYNCSDASSTQVMALFRDGAANAIAAGVFLPSSRLMHLEVEVAASSTSATTFTVRVGTSSGTLTFNGSGGSRVLGGAMREYLMIEEIKA